MVTLFIALNRIGPAVFNRGNDTDTRFRLLEIDIPPNEVSAGIFKDVNPAPTILIKEHARILGTFNKVNSGTFVNCIAPFVSTGASISLF